MPRARTRRLFVAIYPPADAAEAMLNELDRQPLPPARKTPPAQVHLTLVFLGDRDERNLRAITESIERSASGIGAFRLRSQRLATVPTPEQGGPVRLIAAGCDAPAQLLELQRRLAVRLALPGSRTDRFWPHITLARFQPGAAPGPVDRPMELEPFDVERVQLVESRLSPAGVSHEIIRTVPLS